MALRDVEINLPSGKKMFGGATGILLVIFILIAVFKTVIWVSASEIVSVQYLNGKIAWFTEQGPHAQWFGTVTRFHKRSPFWFSVKNDQGGSGNESIKARFNDGGHGNISGSLSWEIPTDEKHLYMLLSKFGSEDAIQQQLVRTVVEKAVYMAGPLMSSKESSAERRNELLNLIEDQVQNGVFKTETHQERQPDPMTGEMRTVSVVNLIKDKESPGGYARSDKSPLTEFGIRTYNLSINDLKYDDAVEEQIQAQQKLAMQVQTAIANAKKAEQDKITAEKNGEATAATAKWAQEAVRAKAIVEAQQKKDVAKLEKDAAEFTKQRDILLGQGQAENRRLIFAADGALALKLKTLENITGRYAQEFGKQKWVSEITMMGGGSAGYVPGSAAMNMMDMLTIQTAKTLGLDLSIKGSGKAQQIPSAAK